MILVFHFLDSKHEVPRVYDPNEPFNSNIENNLKGNHYYYKMNIISPFRVHTLRKVNTRSLSDPEQYDVEINSARGFPVKMQTEDVTFGEVIEAQTLWAQSIVDISNSFLTGGDYVKLAGERAGELYGYGHSNVLFKPTKAVKRRFRPTATDAMSYFVGNDAVISGYKEDQGFAINAKKGFSKVVFENHQVDCHSDVAHAMGVYEFTCATTGEISEVEYTFGYKRNDDGKVRICLHHSSIPYESSNKPRRVPVKQKRVIFYDPDQYDHDENQIRHV